MLSAGSNSPHKTHCGKNKPCLSSVQMNHISCSLRHIFIFPWVVLLMGLRMKTCHAYCPMLNNLWLYSGNKKDGKMFFHLKKTKHLFYKLDLLCMIFMVSFIWCFTCFVCQTYKQLKSKGSYSIGSSVKTIHIQKTFLFHQSFSH